jgi:hypothetical protein
MRSFQVLTTQLYPFRSYMKGSIGTHSDESAMNLW